MIKWPRIWQIVHAGRAPSAQLRQSPQNRIASKQKGTFLKGGKRACCLSRTALEMMQMTDCI